jgi:hypothetical protein
MSINLANRGWCPWCAGPDGITTLNQCRVQEHKDRLAYCREILDKKGPAAAERLLAESRALSEHADRLEAYARERGILPREKKAE